MRGADQIMSCRDLKNGELAGAGIIQIHQMNMNEMTSYHDMKK